MIKLFIFDSVEDARAFHEPADTVRTVARDPEGAAGIEEARPEDAIADLPRKKLKRHVMKKHGAGKPTRATRTRRGKYDPEQVARLTQLTDAGKMTPEQAARELGIPAKRWYSLKYTYQKKGASKAGRREETFSEKVPGMNPDELREEVAKLQEQGLDSLRIAQRLRISLGQVNKYWNAELAVKNTAKEDEDDDDPDFSE